MTAVIGTMVVLPIVAGPSGRVVIASLPAQAAASSPVPELGQPESARSSAPVSGTRKAAKSGQGLNELQLRALGSFDYSGIVKNGSSCRSGLILYCTIQRAGPPHLPPSCERRGVAPVIRRGRAAGS